ncbi:MAG: N-6 DNA methylase [Elusimicrobia bacterium]|nr:N-6 DNA methylase [Elusimicrobiota bacterium]
MKTQHSFAAVTSEGGMLPSDFLQELLKPGSGIDGLEPTTYHLAEGEKLNEAVSRSWGRLKGCWVNFKKSIASKPEGASTTTETRERWLLPLFQELNFGRLPVARAIEIEDKSYAISHQWENIPIHLLGSTIDLDKRTERVAGAAAGSPHSLVQQILNRREELFWGVVSNGLILRLLRDNAALTRQAYVEFDLKAIFDGDLYPDFFLFWILCHQSRFEGEKSSSCWLEKWKKTAEDKGLRALENLRPGVEKAIAELGKGFISHPANNSLREHLSSGRLDKQEFYKQILRTVYRILFLFVAEDRNILHPPKTAQEDRELFRRFYSMGRLRDMPFRHTGGAHSDLWKVFLLITAKLGDDNGCPALGLPALGSFLWSPDASLDINNCQVTNRHFLSAVRAISFIQDGMSRRPVDYKNLGSEELGSVYESLLELHPEIDPVNKKFKLTTSAGHERKTTGSYYTPDSLVQCLLDSALEPVVVAAIKGKHGEAAAQAILGLKVCDPAVGSGHFLIATAHRMAKRVAAARTGEDEPSPQAIRSALREVIGRCLYGVDINPMAAELCKVSLWMEALEPGKPLSFLDHHIRMGNSLLGVTPELLAKGIPDSAFEPIEGDDKKACSALKKLNAREREGFGELFAQQDAAMQTKFQEVVFTIEQLPEDNPKQIRSKAEAFSKAEADEAFKRKTQLADIWCAAFVIPKTFKPGTVELAGITQAQLNDLAQGRALALDVGKEVARLSSECRFFHWHLAFPEVFGRGGFDVVLSNPPWEHTELKEKEWFAERCPDIANAHNGAERKRMIDELKEKEPSLYASFTDALREHDNVGHFLGNSNRYPLCGRGRINLYAVFAEGMRNLLTTNGAMGAILPSGLATDDTTKHFFGDLIASEALWSFFEFENEGFFPGAGQGHMVRFALTTIGGRIHRARAADFVFQAKAVPDLSSIERHFALSAADIALLNPNTRTCPIFRSRCDAELTKAIYRRVPVLVREARDGHSEENSWNIKFKQGLFNMTSDSHLFRTREQLKADGWRLDGNVFRKGGEAYLPLYESKMVGIFTHRFADFADAVDGARAHVLPKLPITRLNDCQYSVTPYYWVPESEVNSRASSNSFSWFTCFRRITDARASARSVICCFIPKAGAADGLPLMLPSRTPDNALPSLVAILNSLVLDFSARFKIGGLHLDFFTIKQLPVLPPTVLPHQCAWKGSRQTLQQWLLPRILELTYTAWDLQPFAQDCGHAGPPFRWNEDRRFLLRCELDAAFFHLYLPAEKNGDWHPAEGETPEDLARLKAHFPTPRDAVAYIMDTFPIVKRKDEEKFGNYRTKDTILEIYNALSEAIHTGQPYQTRLNPPPADPRVAHPPRANMPTLKN